jgi:hypothetical protein
METAHGSHIGFIEGNISEIYSSENCYSYPAKVALEFFDLSCQRGQ